ncbi:MAG TPA: NUDIX domain-containing protein [Pseudonocardiaceae bacterium]|nr:NUDIX domain-containing protein [Pseudonocardiaceae bacterium]
MTRVDYLNDPNAPKANSIAVAVSAFIQDDEGRILMIRRTDNDLYSIPGGQVEPGETLTQAAVRETKEETGIDIEVTGLIGLYSNPNHVIAYDDGEVRQEFSICFRAEPVGGELQQSEESSEAFWIRYDDLPVHNIHESIRFRIQHGISPNAQPHYD